MAQKSDLERAFEALAGKQASYTRLFDLGVTQLRGEC